MADLKISQLAPLSPAGLDPADCLVVVDKDDLSFGPTGTNKRVTVGDLLASSLTVTTQTASYLIDPGDGVILMDASIGDLTATLPPAAANTDERFYIKKIDTTNNLVTVVPAGAEDIDGGPTAPLSNPYEAITVVSDGSNWWIV